MVQCEQGNAGADGPLHARNLSAQGLVRGSIRFNRCLYESSRNSATTKCNPARPYLKHPCPEQRRLPMIYGLIGIACFGLLVPALKSLPSIFAVSVSGISLTVVGACLACWGAHLKRSYIKLAALLAAICVLPFVTIITVGFVGYGSLTALLVFTFVATFYRPRWQAVVGLFLLFFLGLSLFVTYFRDL